MRFTQLNSNSATVSNTPAKVLGINTARDVVFTALYPQVVSTNTTLDANTPANTTLTLGEIQFLTDKTSSGVTGNIQVRSSSASTLAVTIFGHEEYNSGTNNYTAVRAVLNDNLGAFTTFFLQTV
ncbi:hypothetical protein [Flavobacterium soyae]|uniref:hypothetical protein n=1 Tax=Flavobacterium soyae TaxID=2903098 RepID=UPI001E536BF8|nr:hypothetical protein [Flavobacterium soyae]MCD9574340.1 hypothetical protein [Flavobacterium soyae]